MDRAADSGGSVPIAADATQARARAVVAAVTDPEIPVLTLDDLGVLRDVRLDAGTVVVTVTPTYTGCPATGVIAQDIRAALADAGWPDARVDIALTPPWSTDWMSDAGRRKLRDYGIAPPGPAADGGGTSGNGTSGGAASVHPVHLVRRGPTAATAATGQPECPRCSSPRVERLAEHGSTACKALYRCLTCREPFDYFKPY
jgi:ring-1,2-phenylacetyl-CoA epoxidase subunit PaaD